MYTVQVYSEDELDAVAHFLAERELPGADVQGWSIGLAHDPGEDHLLIVSYAVDDDTVFTLPMPLQSSFDAYMQEKEPQHDSTQKEDAPA